ncbi:MAG: hypothetical protein ACREEW_11140 [Caulobacteraceae bacterium]
MRSVFGAVLIFGAVVASPVAAADYYLIDSNANQILVIDNDAIIPNEHGVAAPMVAIRRLSNTGGLNFAYAVVQSDFDCTSRKIGAVSVTVFDREGRPSAQQPQGGDAVVWQPVIPIRKQRPRGSSYALNPHNAPRCTSG